MLRDQARLPSSNPHPYIFLRGVSYLDLCAVVDFIYRGEVSVAQDQLNSFLAGMHTYFEIKFHLQTLSF